MVVLGLLVALLVVAVAAFFSFLKYRNEYWARRGILQESPRLFSGNMGQMGQLPFREIIYNFYMKHRHQAKFAGFYLTLRNALMVFDLDLIKHILIKDFDNFAHRGNYFNEKDDPLTGHLFNLDGPKWKKLRTKLTPTFSSGKMKFMFPTVVEVATRFVATLKDLVVKQNEGEQKEEPSVEIRELLARYTTDVIGSCAFGLECNSLQDPQAHFRLMGKKVFSERRHSRWVLGFAGACPRLARALHIKILPEDVSSFFMQVVKDTVAMRERDNIQKNDFMNILMDLRRNNESEGLSIEEMAAQAFVFFLAGFETSSSTMGFALYELALHQDIQDRARSEIQKVLELHKGELTYAAMNDMKYITQIIQETLRKYSIAPILMRKTIRDYVVPESNEVIEAGTAIVIPVDAIQRDPDIYPEPERYDPDRFTPEEIEKRHRMAWLPFGEGQRNCIGMRFGEMQATIGLVMLLRNFRFLPTKHTKEPIELDTKNFILCAKDGINLKVELLTN